MTNEQNIREHMEAGDLVSIIQEGVVYKVDSYSENGEYINAHTEGTSKKVRLYVRDLSRNKSTVLVTGRHTT